VPAKIICNSREAANHLMIPARTEEAYGEALEQPP
jgi:hypothetical protein